MKKIITGIGLFILMEAFFVGFLLLAAAVPQSSIEKNMKESAIYLCEKEVFFEAIEGVPATKIDHYADSITLNIAWNLSSDDNLRSTMLAAYHFTKLHNENSNFHRAVFGKYPDFERYIDTEALGIDTSLPEWSQDGAMMQYMRYWHGSAALSRLLHLVMPIKSMYILNTIFFIILLAVLVIMLIRKKLFDCIIALAFGLVLTSSWYVPFSLEYFYIYPIVIIQMIAVLILHDKKKEDLYPFVILLGAMLINYFDFLTAETLSLTMPLILMIRLNYENKGVKFIAKNSVIWGVGYAGTWVSKWIISAIVLRENVMPYITGHIAERLGGETEGLPEMSLPVFVYSAVMRNILNMFPAGYGTGGVFAGVILIIIAAYIAYVYRRKGFDKKVAGSFLLIALIPVLRFMVMHNHSYIHYFFTVRALCGTVFALVVDVAYVSELPKRKKK